MMGTETLDRDVGVILALDKIDWEADPIAKAVESNDYNAYLSAVRDKKFDPVSSTEFATLVDANRNNKPLYAKNLIKSMLTDLTKEEVARTKLKLNDLLAYEGMKGMKILIDELKKEGYDTGLLQLMLDPKWDDIGNTVENYLTRLHRSGLGEHATYLTLMANGGKEMMQKAVAMRNKLGLKTKLLAVTALTTLDEQQTQRIYGNNRNHSVLKMAQDAIDAGMDGIVCSSQEATILRGVFGDNFLIVTPGIRSEAGNVENDDQKNINTPVGARVNGVDEEVIGRDILANKKTPNPIEALRNVLTATKGINKGDIDPKLYEFEKILYNGSWEDLLKYIGAFYIRPENGAYVRLASGLLSNGYVNIGVAERNPYVLEKASYELQSMLADKKIEADVVMGAQMGSVRLSSHLAKAMGVEESIYTEKENDESVEEFAERMANKSTHDYQNGISSVQDRQNFITNIVSEYNKLDGMALKRHDLDLVGKKVVISEDVITKATTTRKMIEIVQNAGGTVTAITCLANRTGENTIDGIPLFTAYTPAPFELYYDEKTPAEAVKENPSIPEGALKVEKPKVEWNTLVQSMRNN